jgi:hypothetical protein
MVQITCCCKIKITPDIEAYFFYSAGISPHIGRQRPSKEDRPAGVTWKKYSGKSCNNGMISGNIHKPIIRHGTCLGAIDHQI